MGDAEEARENAKKKLELQQRAKKMCQDIIFLVGLISVAICLSFASHDKTNNYVHTSLQNMFVDSFVVQVSKLCD